MIRGQIELPDTYFDAFFELLAEAPEWLLQAQNQLISLPEFIHFDDIDSGNFPEAGDGVLFYLGFDVFIKDTDWYSLRGGKSFSVGDAIPSAFTPEPPVDYTTQPVGMTRVLYNNTGATINAGDTVPNTGLRNVRIQAAGSVSDVGVLPPSGSQWYSFAKLSAGEAGEFVRVS